VWVQLERPDRRQGPSEERLLICTDPALSATEIIAGYAKRWAVEPLFAAMKHQFGLKDAWQQTRQVLMRWVTLVAAGYALSQILLDPARLPGLADLAPWRPRDARTAGLVQAGFARILSAVGLPALIKAIPRKLPALDSLGTAASRPETAHAA
jgi:alkylated DNA repair dioxygenase AlkB